MEFLITTSDVDRCVLIWRIKKAISDDNLDNSQMSDQDKKDKENF